MLRMILRVGGMLSLVVAGCSGSDGADGADGNAISVELEPAGANCAEGGIKISTLR